MFENKSMQEGNKKAPNALKDGKTYDLEWKALHSFTAEQSIHIKKLEKGHSDATYLHPLGTTAPNSTGTGAYTTGCKGIGYEEDVQVDENEKNLYLSDPYQYRPYREGSNDAQNDSKAWQNSRAAISTIRKKWQEAQDKINAKAKAEGQENIPVDLKLEVEKQ